MFKPVPVAIGLRYLRAKRRNGFISFISMASILGIAIGVAALITTLAVMTGFQTEIRTRMLEMAAHATVTADGVPMENWREAIATARQDPRVLAELDRSERVATARYCGDVPDDMRMAQAVGAVGIGIESTFASAEELRDAGATMVFPSVAAFVDDFLGAADAA